jgi:hypothetical protein
MNRLVVGMLKSIFIRSFGTAFLGQLVVKKDIYLKGYFTRNAQESCAKLSGEDSFPNIEKWTIKRFIISTYRISSVKAVECFRSLIKLFLYYFEISLDSWT